MAKKESKKKWDFRNPLKGVTVLLVDDDPLLLGLITQWLVGYACLVYKTWDGDNALKWIRNHKPDILLTGLHMLGMSGLDLVKKFKTIYPDVPFLLMSGGAEGTDIIEAYNIGACKFIPKPFSEKELLQAIMSGIAAARRHSLDQYPLFYVEDRAE